MSRVADRRTTPLRYALPVLGVALAILLCAPLANLVLAQEAHTCQGYMEFPTLCSKAFGAKEFSPGLVLEPGSPGLATLVSDGPSPVVARTPGAPRLATAWSVRAPPSIH
ncbi:MAG: hypothetical protein HY803_03765 [candidate division NC10 bacterium]|nr:hypothetical protein [candidate division NC10 bacterium]